MESRRSKKLGSLLKNEASLSFNKLAILSWREGLHTEQRESPEAVFQKEDTHHLISLEMASSWMSACKGRMIWFFLWTKQRTIGGVRPTSV